MLSGIDLIISTVSREGNYLDATLESLAADQSIGIDQPVSLVVGSPVTTYLDHHRSRPEIEVIEMGPNAWEWIKNRVRVGLEAGADPADGVSQKT